MLLYRARFQQVYLSAIQLLNTRAGIKAKVIIIKYKQSNENKQHKNMHNG